MTHDFNATYDLYHAPILRYCLWKCRDKESSQDLMQETFLRYWIFLQNKKEVLHIRAFLYRIAHNLFLDQMRKKRDASLDELLEVGFEPAVDPWHHVFSHLDAESVLKKLAATRSPYKQLLHRRFIQGLAPAEIATLTGETANAVSVRIFRGLQSLRSLVEEAPKARM